jgi:hypothetical protein
MDRVQALLDEQHALLISGKVKELDTTAQGLSGLLDKLSDVDVNAPDLLHAQQSARRNQRMLSEAIRAVKDVAARVQRTQAARAGFESYTPYGNSRTVGAIAPKLVKKL